MTLEYNKNTLHSLYSFLAFPQFSFHHYFSLSLSLSHFFFSTSYALMASSDEEGEILPDTVTEYVLVNQADEHVSLACLPLLSQKDEIVDGEKIRVYLSGFCDEGLQKIYKEIVAWRYELSYAQPEISVLYKGSHWAKLLKPKKLYEAALRSILITVQCLHFVKHNPEATEESMWSQFSRVFSYYDVPPSEVDCMNHIPLIKDAADRDQSLKESELVRRLLTGQPMQRNVLQVEGVAAERPEFIDDEDMNDSSEDDELCEEEEDVFDTCCSLCDNGGDILCCEGRCLRSFHASRQTGSLCEGLGLSETQIKAMCNFICKNCKYQQHQCYICGKLGSSDVNSNAEVFPCIAGDCGKFYHPTCVFKELQQWNDTQIENLEEKIAAGESFVCPAHRCFSCKQVEDRAIREMQFAVCRRCPKSYHRKCLPREIAFDTGVETKLLTRAWDGLLPKRILIYCLDHEIDPHLGTPPRNHICFPTLKVKMHTSGKPVTGLTAVLKQTKRDYSSLLSETAVGDTKKKAANEPANTVGKHISGPSFDGQKAYSGKPTITSTAHLKQPSKPCTSSTGLGPDPLIRHSKPNSGHLYREKLTSLDIVKPHLKKQRSSSSGCDIKMERRITALIEKVNSSFDGNEFLKQNKNKSMYSTCSNDMVDKTLSKTKVDRTVKAVRDACQKLDNGGSVEDAKQICSVEMLKNIPVWKKKLKVYLLPFLHGMHYQSYGRHFTKPEKLREIVDRLHHYVQDGDTIVDFCCGANEFSCLMKEKLDSVGKKKCSFKNYDLFPTKNDFNFERKDWFTVDPQKLPPGSQVVMGLNPPFGNKAKLASMFISKALQFKPKLLILIVPPETRRLKNMNRYNLLWKDQHLLSGESFYLPGAFDANEKQISQWNNITPPLYLWSHPDWTRKHTEIADRCGHSLPRDRLPNFQSPAAKRLPEEQQQDVHGDFVNVYGNLPNVVDDVPGPMDKIYTHPTSSAYDHPTRNAYSHPSNYHSGPPVNYAYDRPTSDPYGHSASNGYGNSASNVYGHQPSNVYSRPMSNVYGHDRSHIYSQKGPSFDNHNNVQRAEYPGPIDMAGQVHRNVTETADKFASLPDMDISPNYNPRRTTF